MSIFTIRNNKLEIVPENLIIPEFRTIYDRDTSKDKEAAFAELAYVYHIADYKSVYNNLTDEDKHKQIIKDYLPNGYNPDSEVKTAIAKYRLLQETPSMRLLLDARGAIDKVRKYFKDVDLAAVDGKGSLINKISDLTNSMGNIGKIIESIDKLEEKVKKEQLRDTKIRGQKDINDYERS